MNHGSKRTMEANEPWKQTNHDGSKRLLKQLKLETNRFGRADDFGVKRVRERFFLPKPNFPPWRHDKW